MKFTTLGIPVAAVAIALAPTSVADPIPMPPDPCAQIAGLPGPGYAQCESQWQQAMAAATNPNQAAPRPAAPTPQAPPAPPPPSPAAQPQTPPAQPEAAQPAAQPVSAPADNGVIQVPNGQSVTSAGPGNYSVQGIEGYGQNGQPGMANVVIPEGFELKPGCNLSENFAIANGSCLVQSNAAPGIPASPNSLNSGANAVGPAAAPAAAPIPPPVQVAQGPESDYFDPTVNGADCSPNEGDPDYTPACTVRPGHGSGRDVRTGTDCMLTKDDPNCFPKQASPAGVPLG
jgi:hypothetical protein